MADTDEELIAEARIRAESDLGYVNSLPSWERNGQEAQWVSAGVDLLERLAAALDRLQQKGTEQ